MYLLLKHSVLLSLSGTWKHVKTCLLYVCSVMCVVIWYNTLCHFAVHAHVLLYIIQLSGMPGFVRPWINGMTEVCTCEQYMSDILPTYICTLAHTQFHTNCRLTASTYYTHTCANIYTQCHACSHSRKVHSTLLVISIFPCTMGSWASAVFGGSALAGKITLAAH